MLHNFNISFPKGSIITGQQLQLLYDLPQKYLCYQYTDNSDGVISGMKLEEYEGRIVITPGMYKYGGAIYLLEENFVIQMENLPFEGGQNYSVILSPHKQETVGNIIDIQLQILVVKSDSISNNASTLICSFYGTPQLPKYFEDILSDDFDLIPFPQSCYGENPTYSKHLFRLIYQYLTTEKSSPHMLDYVLISEISGCGFISPLTMRNYITAAGQIAPEFEDRRGFFKAFIESISILINDKSVSTEEEPDTEKEEDFFF